MRKPISALRLQPRNVIIALLFCLGVYVLVCAGCAYCQRRFIYFPPVFGSERVAELARSANLEAWQSTAGKALGWKRLSHEKPAQGQVLITHGNAGCAFQCSHYADVIQKVAPFDVYMVEYPGYADQPGTPTEKSLEAAAAEAFLALDTNRPIYLVGESLGTGLAAYLAGLHSNQVEGVALLAPYDSLVNVAQSHFWLVPAGLLLRDRFPASDFLSRFDRPVAMIVALDDTVIPARFGHRLYEHYQGPKRIWEIPGGDHGSVMKQPAESWEQIVTFWSQSPRQAGFREQTNRTGL
jgi:pimeloyl-ACP methyl ester carboxylesterase